MTKNFYLHKNKRLVHTTTPLNEGDFKKDFILAVWKFETDIELAEAVIEAAAMGATIDSIQGIRLAFRLSDEALEDVFTAKGGKLAQDGNSWHAVRFDYINPMQSPEGFGDTKIDAIGELIAQLGFEYSKDQPYKRALSFLEDQNETN